jgi:hypothetical protein
MNVAVRSIHWNAVSSGQPRIPHRIIQTGKDGELPLLERAASASVRHLNGEFEYCFFNDRQVEDFVGKEFPECLNIFNDFRYPIQRYDLFRYLAVYRLGGFYLDLDVLLALGMSSLSSHACVFPFEEMSINNFLRNQLSMDWEIGNYAFGAEAGHPFLRKVIENCIRAQRDPGWLKPMMSSIPRVFREDFYVLNSTGPGLISRTLAENPDIARSVTVLFPSDVCDLGARHQFGNYGVHLMRASWRKGNRFRRRLSSLWQDWKQRKLLVQSQRLGPTRTY